MVSTAAIKGRTFDPTTIRPRLTPNAQAYTQSFDAIFKLDRNDPQYEQKSKALWDKMKGAERNLNDADRSSLYRQGAFDFKNQILAKARELQGQGRNDDADTLTRIAGRVALDKPYEGKDAAKGGQLMQRDYTTATRLMYPPSVIDSIPR